MLDFNNEEQQTQWQSGPVPAGSKVLLRLELQTPRYAAQSDPLIAQSRSGLLQLFCKFTVAAGSYSGNFWFENITLPGASQQIRMDDKQKLSARIGGSTIRAIVEASRRINPNDSGNQARRARCLNSWNDLDGMEFPASVGIDKRPYVKDGVEYWNNRISRVITCDDKDFPEIVGGGEIITDGPVKGKSDNVAPRSSTQARDAAPPDSRAPSAPQYGEGGPLNTNYNTAYDDVPF